MHIFNLKSKPNLILTDTELLFRDTPTDEQMKRHPFTEVEKISLEHRYDANKELFIWLKVQMKTDPTPLLIQLSTLDTPLEEVLTILSSELENKVNITLPSEHWIHQARTHHKKRKQIFSLAALLLISIFLFHKFYTPTLNNLSNEAVKKQFQNSTGLCSVNAKAAFKTPQSSRFTIKNYCGVFGTWQEQTSKEISSRHLETEFSKLTVADYLKQAQDEFKKGAYPSAVNSIANIYYLDPNNLQAHLLLGRVNYALGNKEKAFNSLKKALTLDSKSTLALNTIVYYYLKEENYDEAYIYAKKALALQANAQELRTVAAIESELGKTDEAISHYEKSRYEDANNTTVLTQLGLLYWKTNAYKKAESVLHKAYQVDSNSSSTFLNYYEISLVEQTSLGTTDIESFEKNFKDEKKIFMRYEMLNIIKLSINNENIMPSLKRWDQSYSGTKLNWSFKEMLSWVDDNTMKEEQKYAIKKTIGFFIAYQQIYNLEHQDQKEAL